MAQRFNLKSHFCTKNSPKKMSDWETKLKFKYKKLNHQPFKKSHNR